MDGGEPLRLTSGKKEDSSPRFSPDGEWIAFLSDREGKKKQVYLLSRKGGEAVKLTDYEADVSDLAWSPDSKRLALVVSDVDPDATDEEDEEKTAGEKKKTAKPIVLRRLQFKRDGEGYLREVRKHVHVFDLEKKTSVQVDLGPLRRLRPRLVARRAVDRLRQQPHPARPRPIAGRRRLRGRGARGPGPARRRDGSRDGRLPRLQPRREVDRLRRRRRPEGPLVRREPRGAGAGRRRRLAAAHRGARPQRHEPPLHARRPGGALPPRGPGQPAPRPRAGRGRGASSASSTASATCRPSTWRPAARSSCSRARSSSRRRSRRWPEAASAASPARTTTS